MECYGRSWKVLDGDGTVEPSRIFLLEKVYKELTPIPKKKEPPPTLCPDLVIAKLGRSFHSIPHTVTLYSYSVSPSPTLYPLPYHPPVCMRY